MMTVRPMTKRDIARVYEIEVQSFRSPWSKLSLLGELHNNVARYLVAEEEGRIVGYGGMWVLFDEAHITNIAIAPESRGKHLGRYLLYGMMVKALGYGAERMTTRWPKASITASILRRKAFASGTTRTRGRGPTCCGTRIWAPRWRKTLA